MTRLPSPLSPSGGLRLDCGQRRQCPCSLGSHQKKREPDITPGDGPSPLDYDVSTRRARKMQAEAIAAVGRTIGKIIGRVVAKTIGSLRDHWRTQRQIASDCLTSRRDCWTT